MLLISLFLTKQASTFMSQLWQRVSRASPRHRSEVRMPRTHACGGPKFVSQGWVYISIPLLTGVHSKYRKEGPTLYQTATQQPFTHFILQLRNISFSHPQPNTFIFKPPIISSVKTQNIKVKHKTQNLHSFLETEFSFYFEDVFRCFKLN